MTGAAGALAFDAVLQAPAERGNLLLGGLDHVAYSHLNSSRRPLDPFVDSMPVAAVNRDLFAPAALAPLAPRINAWLREVLVLPAIVQRYRDAFIEPTPAHLAETTRMVRERLQLVDAMRRAVFGRSR